MNSNLQEYTTKVIFVILLSIIFVACAPQKETVHQQDTQTTTQSTQKLQEVKPMKLTSPDFQDMTPIPQVFTCDGEDISPQLDISDVPENTKSLVLIMDDPDALKPAGKIWDHWIVFNIPPDTTTIYRGEEPQGIQGKTSFGSPGYGGPCPPDGEHRYFFKLYAIDKMLDIAQGASKAEVEQAMNDHIIEQTQLRGSYIRPTS